MAERSDRVGAWAEQVAVSYYLKLGWDVFSSVCAGSPIDLIIVKENCTRYLDVKYRRSHKPSGRKLSEHQLALKVELVHVMDSGKVIDNADPTDPQLG